MSDLRDAAWVLSQCLKRSFLLTSQVDRVRVLVEEVMTYIEGKDLGWREDTNRSLFPLVVFFNNLIRFVRIHFVVKESAPRELPHLRKLRTLLCINGLQSQLEKLFSELKDLIMDSPLAEKFNAEYFADIFSEDEVEVRKQNDFFKARDAMKKIKANVLKYMKKKHPEFVVKIKTLIEAFLEDTETTTDFSAFDRIEFIRLMPDVDDLLLLVNRNIERMAVGNNRRKLQNDIPFSHLDLDSTTPQDEATALQLFDGNLGDFTYAFLKGTEGGEKPVVVQKVSMEMLHDLSSSERLHFGYNLRQIEMNPSDCADKTSTVKGFGHVLHEDMLYIMTERLEFNMAGLATGSRHVYTSREILHIGNSLAKALSALHHRGYVHGAVRPENVFFSADSYMGPVKLANFSHGLSAMKNAVGLMSDVTLNRSSSKEEENAKESKDIVYLAPEILASQSFSKASDVYSLGMILWEMMHPGKLAFEYPVTPPGDLETQILQKERPLIDYEIHTTQIPREDQLTFSQWLCLADVVECLWEHDPWKRDTASVVIEQFSIFSNPISLYTNTRRFSNPISLYTNTRRFAEEPIPPGPPPYLYRNNLTLYQLENS